jgi:hypothetical protein
MQESVYSPRPAARRLPANAPNILIVLIDDAGPALPSTYGGEINTPTLDRIHEGGVSFNPVPHHRDVLSNPGFAAHQTQPPPYRQRAAHRARERLVRLFRYDPQIQRDTGRGLEEIWLRHRNVLGSAKTDNMYHAGWGWAGSAPYKHTKQACRTPSRQGERTLGRPGALSCWEVRANESHSADRYTFHPLDAGLSTWQS